jgi:SagB-type dehydrogenase family enzyme
MGWTGGYGLWALVILACATLAGCVPVASPTPPATPAGHKQASLIPLPSPRLKSEISLEEALLRRRSVRSYQAQPLTLAEVSQLLWAAQGITDPRGFRTAPSAGALYPLEVYLVAGQVEGIESGVYRYRPASHGLEAVAAGDKRLALYQAALFQEAVRTAPAVIVLTAVYSRTTGKYGERGIRYVHMEAGHAGQNILLQAVALDLGAVVIGAFYDEQVRQALGIPAAEQPLYIVPVGRR